MSDTVLVNIADFKTMLYRDKQLVWETKAQVGRTYRKRVVLTNVSYSVNYCKLVGMSEVLKDFVTME